MENDSQRPWPVLLMVRELGIGGCERDLTKIAKRLDRSRFEPHVGCFIEQGLRTEELYVAGVPVVRFPVTSFRSPSFVRGISVFRRYVKKHGIRLLHSFDAPTNAFGIAAARVSGLRPVIASQLWFLDTIPRQLSTLHRLSLRFADAVLVNSDAVRRQLIQQSTLPPHRIHMSHNGVETDVFSPRAATAGDESGSASPTVGAVCALRPEKRLDLLLDAFARIRKECPGTKLLIVGSGEMLPALEQQRDRLGLTENCTFKPAQTDVVPWMRSLDVFVMSSDSESFPNALLEAMACGCCVVGSDVGGIPELIVSGESGLLFRPGNALDLSDQVMRVLTDPALRQRFASNARTRATAEFSMEQAVERIQRLYTSLLAAPSTRR